MDDAESRVAIEAEAHANIGEAEPVRLPPLLKCAKNFHGELIRFDIEETGEGHRAFVYGFIGKTAGGAWGAVRGGCVQRLGYFPRFGDECENSSPRAFL